MPRLCALLLALALAAAACSSSKDDGPDTSPSSRGTSEDTQIGDAAAGDVSRSEPGRLRVTVGGDLDFEYDEEIDLRIVVIRHPEITAVRFLSVGIEQLQALPDDSAFRVAFDLAGVFDGSGDYEIPAVGSSTANPDDPGAAVAQGVSKPFVTYSPGGLPTENPAAATQLRSFENALKPCEVAVREDDGGAGTLDCPEITDTQGQGRISLRMEWSTA